MFPESLLDVASYTSSYSRALAIVKGNRVLSLDASPYTDKFTTLGTGNSANRFKNLVLVEAEVKGSQNSIYDVEVVLNMDSETVDDYFCTCPAHSNYSGMCKHALAAALRYLDLKRQQGSLYVSNRVVVDSKPGSNTVKATPKRPEPETSGSISNMMRIYAGRAQEFTDRASAQRIGQEALPLATLQVELSQGGGRYDYSNNDWRLGLKILRGKLHYVVKDIVKTVDAWEQETMLSYGKKLAFIHSPAAFDERSNKLLALLSSIIEAQWALHKMREAKSYYFSSQQFNFPKKELPITSLQVIEVLDLMQGQTISFKFPEIYTDRASLSARKVELPVRVGNPPLKVQLAKGDLGGWDLSIKPIEALCIWAEKRSYVVTPTGAFSVTERFHNDLGIFCWAMLPADKLQHINKDDMSRFCATLLPALRELTDLDEAGYLDELMPPQATIEFRIGEENGYIICRASVLYDDLRMDLFEPAAAGQPVRHVVREVEAQNTVASYFKLGDNRIPDYANPAYSSSEAKRMAAYTSAARKDKPTDEPTAPYFEADDDNAYFRLFDEGLRELSRVGEVLLSEKLARVSVRSAPSVRVDASVKNGLLDLQVGAANMTPAELASYLASYRRRQRFVRLDNGDIARLDGSIQVLDDLAAGLDIKPEALVEGECELPANRTLFVDSVLKRSGVRFERDEGFRSVVRAFDTIADASFKVPDNLADVLRPYQVDGFKWLCTLGKLGFGGILADDMGLGKTLQMIAYLQHISDEGEQLPALVVCPASLVYNWQAEIERFAPSLKAVPVVGTAATRKKLIAHATAQECDTSSTHKKGSKGRRGTTAKDTATSTGCRTVLLTSYDLLRRDVDTYTELQFSCVVLDEAQYVKNSTTKAAKAVRALQGKVRFALTGTPIENRLLELWSIFDFLMPGTLGSAESFSRRFASPIGNGDEAVAHRLQSLVSPFILRRLKGDVLTDLPEKNESVVLANMDGEQGKLYRANADRLAQTLSEQPPEEFAHTKLAILAELTKLRQLCCDPRLVYDNYTQGSAKLETCIELVRNAVEGGHSLLLFSQFTSMFPYIEERLAKEGIRYFELTGATSKEERAKLVERFQAREANVFLISLKAGGVGLNLTAADIVIHYDPWWNLAAQNQATDRAHRIGQEREVSVFKLIAKGTIEEKIVELQESKRDLAESILGGEGVSAATITRENLLALLDSANHAEDTE